MYYLFKNHKYYEKRGYGPFVSVQPESGTLAGGTTSVADANASGGTSLRFGTGGVSRCPAYPAFPDENCTGVIPGSTLTACNGNITTPNQTFTNCLFSSGIVLGDNAKNIKISNSRILGVVHSSSGWLENANLEMVDVEIDGQSTTADQIGGITHYSCNRCNIHHGAKNIAGGQFHIEDSYLHSIYGQGDSHNESILPFDGHNNVIRHNNIVSNWSSSTNQGAMTGGMSAAIALYTHSDFWGSIDNVLIEKNRITTSYAWYCMYGGHTNDVDGQPSNLRVIDSVFGPCSFQGPEVKSPIVGWLRGNGNVWSNNTWYSDDSIIPEPSTHIYN